MSYILGLDIGGTKISAGLTVGKWVSKIIHIPTETHKGKAQIIHNIVKVIGIFHHEKISCIGIGMAGAINQKKGVVVSSPNLPKTFSGIPLAKIITKKFGKKVYIENDANCFTLAEAVYGSGKKYKNVIGLTLGTGIGGGIVFDKKIYHGRDGLAGELGHMTIVEDGLRCSCGGYGHIEVYASGTAMARMYERFTGQRKSAIEIERLAKSGDKNALRVVRIMNQTLGFGFANIMNIFNPDIIVLGGGMARVRMIWQVALDIARKNVVYTALANTKVVEGKLGMKGPILGAALITKQSAC